MFFKTKKNHDLSKRNDIKRILIIRWSAMGDVVICSTVFEDIYRAFPQSEIHLNTMPAWKNLFDHDPRFSKVIYSSLRKAGLRAYLSWLKQVNLNRYDLIIDMQCNDRSRLLIGLLSIFGHKVSYRAGNHKRFPYNYYPSDTPPERQAIEVFRDIVRSIGIIPATIRPTLYLPKANVTNAQRLIEEHRLQPGHYAVLFPGSQAAGHLKRWGASHYAELATKLHTKDISNIILIGGADDEEECTKIKNKCGDWLINLCGKTQILDIIPLCQSAKIIISNDTGTAHLASATDRPMLIICGPTDPRRVKPNGDNVRTIQANLPCINCYQKECSHHSCMTTLDTEHVLHALAPMLE